VICYFLNKQNQILIKLLKYFTQKLFSSSLYTKEAFKIFQIKQCNSKKTNFIFCMPLSFYEFVLTSISEWDSFSTTMLSSLPATRKPFWRFSIHSRRALQPLLGPRIPQKAPPVLYIPLLSPHFLYWTRMMTTTNLITISLL
jgi:hypothetical protein